MQQTEQFKLNQWDPKDRIQREDFNHDNVAIEAALLALRSDKLEKKLIFENELNMKDMFSRGLSILSSRMWDCEFCTLEFSTPQDSILYINKEFGNHWSPSGGIQPGFATLKAGIVSRFLFLPLKDPNSLICAWSLSGTPMCCYTDIIFNDLKFLTARRPSGNFNGYSFIRIKAFK